MPRPRNYRDEEWLCDRLRDHCSRREIAEECGVREEAVAMWIDRFAIRLYRDEDWLRERVEAYWTPAQIAADCAVTERTVERWMDEFGIERPDPPTVSELERHLDERFDDPEAASKKERIRALLETFGHLGLKRRIVEVVDCTADYASRFYWSDAERRVKERHMRERESESIHERLRESVLERDGRECVRCGDADEDEIEIHHIVPGESTEENLAALCLDCHLAVHGGAFRDGVAYDSHEEFWKEWTRVVPPG